MGRAISKLKHPFRNFNVESRAHKVISQPTPTPAPKHAKDALDVKRMREEYAEEFEKSLKKDETLDKRLKDVFVVSHNEPIEQAKYVNPSRPLPQERSQPDAFLFGHKEPDRLPAGKVTLRNALQFISQHQNEPRKHTVDSIVEQYKLPKETVESILKYFKVFEVYIPEPDSKKKTQFAGPSRPKIEIIKHVSTALPPPSDEKKKDNT